MSEQAPRLLFRKSSYSANSVNCVEVADTTDGAAVRDSKNPQLGILSVAAPEWAAFLSSVKRGEV